MQNHDDRSLKAVLFDIDGTLMDSNYLHVEAFDRAFVAAGHPVDTWRIHRSIGMDSSTLLETLLGDDAETVGDAIKEGHSENYLAMADRLRPIGGAQEILRELAARGHQVVLATSSPEKELEVLLEVLDVDDAIAATTSSDDVESAKPEPDIIEVALSKVDAAASDAVMVGDSVWDVKASLRAGVPCIGVLSGGSGRQELLEAGAAAVYDDVAELLAELDSSPIVA
ncbi:HAD family hydrolase [Herbiconiux liukaitaii]|uniref:HAD family hydrolase n=1 Tax=Herbiconiux liukaitaii TaxID=3342799 RepID=UPI0035B7EE52